MLKQTVITALEDFPIQHEGLVEELNKVFNSVDINDPKFKNYLNSIHGFKSSEPEAVTKDGYSWLLKVTFILDHDKKLKASEKRNVAILLPWASNLTAPDLQLDRPINVYSNIEVDKVTLRKLLDEVLGIFKTVPKKKNVVVSKKEASKKVGVILSEQREGSMFEVVSDEEGAIYLKMNGKEQQLPAEKGKVKTGSVEKITSISLGLNAAKFKLSTGKELLLMYKDKKWFEIPAGEKNAGENRFDFATTLRSDVLIRILEKRKFVSPRYYPIG